MNEIDTILSLIAKNHLGMDTLEVQNSDRLDFHDVSVSNIKKTLHASFMAGCEVGIKAPIGTDLHINLANYLPGSWR